MSLNKKFYETYKIPWPSSCTLFTHRNQIAIGDVYLKAIIYIWAVSTLLHAFSAQAGTLTTQARPLPSNFRPTEILSARECQALISQQRLMPFTTTEAHLTRDEINAITDIFDRNSENKYDQRYNQDNKATLYFKRPFVLNSYMNKNGDLREDIFQSHMEISEDDVKKLTPIFAKLLKRMLQESSQHAILSRALPRRPYYQVRFFGLRYILEPGQETSALWLHRDHASLLQSVTTVNRPAELKGGQTIIAWPRLPQINSLRAKLPSPSDALTTWEPEQKNNHMLIFDGHNTFHGTSPFIVPHTESTTLVFRDVLGLIIFPAEVD